MSAPPVISENTSPATGHPGIVLATFSLVVRVLHEKLKDEQFWALLANVISVVAGLVSIAFIVWQWRLARKKKEP